MQHGSLSNVLSAGSNSREGKAHEYQWEVGQGATVLHWTDRHAYTVIAVEGEGEKQVVTIQRDEVAIKTGPNGEPGTMARYGYDYAANPEGDTHVVRFGAAGWRTVKESTGRYGKKAGYGVMPGRSERYDYGF